MDDFLLSENIWVIAAEEIPKEYRTAADQARIARFRQLMETEGDTMRRLEPLLAAAQLTQIKVLSEPGKESTNTISTQFPPGVVSSNKDQVMDDKEDDASASSGPTGGAPILSGQALQPSSRWPQIMESITSLESLVDQAITDVGPSLLEAELNDLLEAHANPADAAAKRLNALAAKRLNALAGKAVDHARLMLVVAFGGQLAAELQEKRGEEEARGQEDGDGVGQ